MRKITLLFATLVATMSLMAQTVSLTVNVDMQPAITDAAYGFTQTSGTVVLAGTFNDWTQPGNEGTVYMTKVEGTETYTASVDVAASVDGTEVKFKIFILDNDKTPSWDFGDNVGGDRILNLYEANVNTNIAWGDATTVDVVMAEQLVFNVYPNPFNNSLTIENADNAKEIRISNILGQQVMQVNNLEAKMVIPTGNLQNGIYLVTILDKNNNVRTERVVKQ